jgi:hypothetical protein
MKIENKLIKQIVKKPYILFFFVLLLSLGSILPLLHKGFISTDDGSWMIIRFSAFHQAFIHGQIPTRFLPRLNFEYGYPVADFLYPGFMYFAEPIHLLKINFINTIKILFALSLICSALFTYLWLSKHTGKFSATVGALVSLYSPYHLTDIYTRGSLGEILALAIVPFIFWMIDNENILLTSSGIGMLLLAHNTLAALFLPVIIIYMGISWTQKPTIAKAINQCIALVLGVGTATFFWLPALTDLHNTVFSQTKVSDWQQYFAPMTEIGVLNMALFLLGIIGVFFLGKRHTKRRVGIFFLILTACSIFLSLPFSAFLWRILPVSFVQFPFRILSIEIISLAYLTAFCLDLIKPKQRISIGIIITIIALTFAIPLLIQVKYLNKDEGFYTTNEDTTTVKNEYMPTWVKVLPNHRPDQRVTAPQAEITNILDKTNKLFFMIIASSNTIATVNLIYFPGWQAKIDGNPIEIRYNNPIGVIQIPIEKGTHDVQIFFTETPMRIVADAISLSSIALLLGVAFIIHLNKQKKYS